MNQDNESWPPKPSELEIASKPNNLAMVSVIPLGIASCVLSSLLFGTHVALLWRLHQMNMQEKISFLMMHFDTIGALKGAEIVGFPVALILGGLSWHSKVGKASLVLIGSFLCMALYFYLSGMALSFVFGSGIGHSK